MNEVAAAKEVKVIRPTKGLFGEKKTRVAAYCRVSTDSDDQENSFIAQVRYYNDFIRLSQDMTLVDVYADEGITGTSVNKRDDFNRMVKDSKLGKIDRIFVKSVSRFARNSLECIEFIRLLKSYGTTVLFENDGIDTETMNSEMILYIKSAFAQSESLSGSKRLKTAIRMKMETGQFYTYIAPFGYKAENKTLIPVPEEAVIVRKIFSDYIAGKGIGKIVADFNKDKTIPGYPWGKERVRYILSNEKYIGDSLFQKTYTPEILPLRNVRNKGEADMYYVEGTHEAIIDKETFATVKAMIEQNKLNDSKKEKGHKHSFTGKIFCGDCGWAYKKRVSNGERTWVCSKDGTAGQRCASHPITEEALGKTFVVMYNKLRQHEDLIIKDTLNRLLELKKSVFSGCEAIGDIDTELAELSEQNNMYVQLHSQSIIDEVTFMEQTNEIRQRINELRSRRLKLLNADEEEQCIEQLRQIKQYLDEMPRAILWFDSVIFENLVSKVVVQSKDVVMFELHSGIQLKEHIIWN